MKFIIICPECEHANVKAIDYHEFECRHCGTEFDLYQAEVREIEE